MLLVSLTLTIKKPKSGQCNIFIRYRQDGLSPPLSLAIFVGAFAVVSTIALDFSFPVVKDVFSSTLNLTAVDGIRCDTMEFTKFHVHAHLDIIVDGKPFIVPSQIGIDPDGRCLYWLHTHDVSGIIHIESPVKREFTIGNFIDIWGQTFNTTHLGCDSNVFNDINGVLNIYVNGVKVPTGSDIRSIEINAHDEIALIFGTIEAEKIPSRYEFQQGL
jgi:hypothetical protein